MKLFLLTLSLVVVAMVIQHDGVFVHGCASSGTPAATSTSTSSSSTTTTSVTTTGNCQVQVDSTITGYGGTAPTCTGTTCTFSSAAAATIPQAPNGCTGATFFILTSSGQCTLLDNGGANNAIDTGAATSFQCVGGTVVATVTIDNGNGVFDVTPVSAISCGTSCPNVG